MEAKEIIMQNKKRVIDPIPESFATEAEAGEFWDTHSTADYLEFLEPAPSAKTGQITRPMTALPRPWIRIMTTSRVESDAAKPAVAVQWPQVRPGEVSCFPRHRPTAGPPAPQAPVGPPAVEHRQSRR